jgi:hypothetical protein
MDKDSAALQADCVDVQSWLVPNTDEALLADCSSNGASVEELAMWADESVTYEDQDMRNKRPRSAGGSDKDKRPKAKHRPERGTSSGRNALQDRARTPPRHLEKQSMASVSNRLEDQIAQQTKNAYTFVRAVY